MIRTRGLPPLNGISRDDQDIDYAEAYSDVKAIGSELPESDKSGKVKTIYGMYVSLNELGVSKETDVSEVEELVVVADVVAIDSSLDIKLPGTWRVVILCRVIEFKHKPIGPYAFGDYSKVKTRIDTSLQQPEVKFEIQGKPPKDRKITFTTPLFDAKKRIQLYVFAQGERGTVDYRGKTLYTEDSEFKLQLGNTVYDRDRGFMIGCKVQIQPYRGQGPNAFGERTLWNGDSVGNEMGVGVSETQELGSSVGFVVSAKFTVPVNLLLDRLVVMGLQALLPQAQGILLYGEEAAGKDAVAAALLHIEWLTTFVLPNRDEVEDHGDKVLFEELNSLYVRAQGLLSLYEGGTPTLIVPPLNYKLYRDAIEQVASTARLYDEDLKAIFRQLQTIEGTKKATDSNFVKLFEGLAAKEKDVEELKGKVLDFQNVELKEAQRNLKRLSDDMQVQEKAMKQAKKDMDEETKELVKKKKAEAVFGVLIAICSVAGAVATGGATAGSAFKNVKDLMDNGEKLEKVLEVLEKLAKVLEALKKLSDVLEKNHVPSTRLPNSPTASDWDIFDNEVELVVNKLPEEISGRHDWKTKCRNVAARGREISIVAFQVTTVQYQQKLAGWEKDIAFKHRERLLSINPVDPPTHREVVMNLELQGLRMRNSLLEMLNIQKGALRYHYLQAPKEVVRMGSTIYNVQEMLIQNDMNAVVFNETLGKSSELQKEYLLKDIPVQMLLSGEEFHQTIAKDDPNFPASWQRVRIQHLTMRFTGDNKPSTDTGKIYLLLSGDHEFVDRYNDEYFEFEAAKALQYPYAYHLETGKCTLDNREIPSELGNFMRMTPFSRWKLLVPNSAYENKNLSFEHEGVDDVTDITITFHLTLVRKIELEI